MKEKLERHIEVAIVGAGFSGLCMGIRLKEAGLPSFVIFETAADLGGTWRDNSYPGCACDVPSHLYSFSFYPKADWSHAYSGYAEIFAYMQDCATHFGLEPFFRFGTGIATATFSETEGLWHLRTQAGETWTARFLVGATGGLSDPHVPDLPGNADFAGPQFHSQAWDHALDLRGKRVAIIGTGASAIQFMPHIAEEAGAVHLFQRTPPWVLPKPDRTFSEAAKRRFGKWPLWQRLYRNFLYWKAEATVLAFVYRPGLMRLMQPSIHRKLRRTVEDPKVAQALLPRYRMGCKRVLQSNDYFAAFNRESVHLVTDGIARLEAGGVRTENGTLHPADVLVYATGFRATEYLSQVSITGRAGRSLAEVWAENGGEAYLGTTVAGFPNMFLFTGPNTGLGHNSIIYIIESQANYIMDAIQQIRKTPGQWADAKPAVQIRYNARLQKRLAGTVWQVGGCQSWYQMESGKNTTLWPGFTFAFRWRTRRFDAENYEFGGVREQNDITPNVPPRDLHRLT